MLDVEVSCATRIQSEGFVRARAIADVALLKMTRPLPTEVVPTILSNGEHTLRSAKG